MPNTNLSDLDREALKAALGAWTWQMSYTSGEIEENLQSAIEAYLTALPHASGVPEAEAVAWRMKPKTASTWGYAGEPLQVYFPDNWDIEPLFASPPPVAAPSGGRQHYPDPTPEMLKGNPVFDAIWNAIKGWDISRHNDGTYSGPTGNDARHIYDALPSPIASEPKDAPSGEALRYAAQFLIDRLEDFELDETNAKEMCRQYLGFVEPAIACLKTALAAPPPVAAPSGEVWQWATGYDKSKGWTISTSSLEAVQKKIEAQGWEARWETIEAIILLTQSAPPSPIASEPKDAGSGEGLKPCPFCGKQPETHYHYDGMDIYGVGCGGHAGFDGETLKEAADKWNTRTAPSGAKP